MFPYPLGVLILLQGLYSLLWIVVLMDVLSPTLDLREVPGWSGAQTAMVLKYLHANDIHAIAHESAAIALLTGANAGAVPRRSVTEDQVENRASSRTVART